MKKIFKIGIMLSSCLCCLSACQIGGGTIFFDANNNSPDPTAVHLNNGDTLKQLPTPYKNGYDFIGWCYDKELTRLASAPIGMGVNNYTLYAKYKIDEEQFLNQTILWTNPAPLDYACDAYTSSYLLLHMLPSMGKLGSIHFTNTDAATIVCVSDCNGIIIQDKNPAPDVWEAATATTSLPYEDETYQSYVIEVSNVNGATLHFQIA